MIFATGEGTTPLCVPVPRGTGTGRRGESRGGAFRVSLINDFSLSHRLTLQLIFVTDTVTVPRCVTVPDGSGDGYAQQNCHRIEMNCFHAAYPLRRSDVEAQIEYRGEIVIRSVSARRRKLC